MPCKYQFQPENEEQLQRMVKQAILDKLIRIEDIEGVYRKKGLCPHSLACLALGWNDADCQTECKDFKCEEDKAAPAGGPSK